jgi:hypothetical protein
MFKSLNRPYLPSNILNGIEKHPYEEHLPGHCYEMDC